MTTITYKTILPEGKPYPEKEKDDYLEFLKSNQEKINKNKEALNFV